MNDTLRRPFRAGGTSSQPVYIADGTGPVTYVCDISEFQPDLADAAYLRWSKAIIIRAAYGDQHDDNAWYGGARRLLLHENGVAFLGIYQYLVAGQDPAAQARELIRLLGTLRPGEKIIADIEEGTGNLYQTWTTWADIIHDALGDWPWRYSGLYFAADHGMAPVDWLADYTSIEPGVPHKLWQFTDSFNAPGAGVVDCSLFHGTVAELAAWAHKG